MPHIKYNYLHVRYSALILEMSFDSEQGERGKRILFHFLLKRFYFLCIRSTI